VHFAANELEESHVWDVVRLCLRQADIRKFGARPIRPLPHSIVLGRARPFNGRWSGQYQHEQHHYGSDDQRDQESAEKAEAAVGAAESRKNAKHNIDDDEDRLGHSAMSFLCIVPRSTLRSMD
jgi:hypothetical protein